jgi:hypothetical protein
MESEVGFYNRVSTLRKEAFRLIQDVQHGGNAMDGGSAAAVAALQSVANRLGAAQLALSSLSQDSRRIGSGS